jgi:DNA (cytosine-5)-methyltransferase 1
MIKHVELFAGIGGFRQAIDLLGNDFNISTQCVGFSERDPYALKTYRANFQTEGEIAMGDIELFTQHLENIKNMPDFDLLTGGFPCQPFSMMGKQLGFEDDRGNLFNNIIDILKEKQPRFVLLENVKNLKTHDNGNTLKVIGAKLRAINYTPYFDVFNTKNFSLAQTRNRIFIFATNQPLPFGFYFAEDAVKFSFRPLNGQSSIMRQKTVLDILEKEVASKYYLSQRIKPTILANGSGNFISKSEINQLIARPLTATMVKMHRACQDNYYSDGFIMADSPNDFLSNKFSKEDLVEHNIRKITPQEAFALQGFNADFYQKAQNAGVSDHQLYRQAGNAVSVNTVYAILYHLFIKSKLLNNESK